jgi:hypothetical protein
MAASKLKAPKKEVKADSKKSKATKGSSGDDLDERTEAQLLAEAEGRQAAEEAEEAAEEAKAKAETSLGTAEAMAAAASSATEGSASLKNFRHHPEMENFYRFIFENDLRLEALELIDKRLIERGVQPTDIIVGSQAKKAATKKRAPRSVRA